MDTITTITFEDWVAEQMKDPEFRAAAEKLEPEYQATRLLLIMCAQGNLTVEYEEDYYIVSDDRFLRYAVGSTLAEAKENYAHVLLEYYEDLCDMEKCLAPHLAYDLQELRAMLGLKKLASLAVEIAEELRDEGAVIDLGQRYGLSSLDLVLEGPSGDLAQGPLYDKATDFIPRHAATREHMPIERAADEIKEHILPLRNWRSVAYKRDLKTIFLSIRRSVGAERRYLHTRGGKPELPGDPLIMF